MSSEGAEGVAEGNADSQGNMETISTGTTELSAEKVTDSPPENEIKVNRMVYDIDTLIGLKKYASISHDKFGGAFIEGLSKEPPLQGPEEQAWTPHRQPLQPGSQIIQLEENFVKFLKMHTSPPHNRVTAGGRIVKAGPRIPPPTFNMDIIDGLLKGAGGLKEKEDSLKERGIQAKVRAGNVSIPKSKFQRVQDAHWGNLENLPHDNHTQARWMESYHGEERSVNLSRTGPKVEVHQPQGSSSQASVAYPLPNRSSAVPAETPVQTTPILLPSAHIPSVLPKSSVAVSSQIPLRQASSSIPSHLSLKIPRGAEIIMRSADGLVFEYNGLLYRTFLNSESKILYEPMVPHISQSAQAIQHPVSRIPPEFYNQIHGEQITYDQMMGPGMQYTSLPQSANNETGFQGLQDSFSAFSAINTENGLFETQHQSNPATQIRDLSAASDALNADLRKVEKQIAAESHAMSSGQLSLLTARKRFLVERLDEIRKTINKINSCLQEVTAKREITPMVPLARNSSENTNPDIGPSAALPERLMTNNGDATMGFHTSNKPLSPDAPVFVPSGMLVSEHLRSGQGKDILSASSLKSENMNTGIGVSSEPRGSAELVPDYLEPSKPKVLAVDAAYSDEMGYNNPKAPKLYCSTPQEFSEVIEAARCCAKYYGCKGGHSKDPEYDAELDIRDAMQQKLPIPLKKPGDPCRPWDFKSSFFNVYSYNSSDWEAPRYARQPGEVQMPPENMNAPKCLHILHSNPFFLGWKDPCPLCEANRKEMIIENGRYYWVHHINGSTWVLENDQIVPCEAVGNPEPLEGAWRSQSGSWKLPEKYQALDKVYEARNSKHRENTKASVLPKEPSSMGNPREKAPRFQFLNSRQKGPGSAIPRLGDRPSTSKIAPRSMKSPPSEPAPVVFNIGSAQLSALPGTQEFTYWKALRQGARLLKEKARREREQGLAEEPTSRLRTNEPPAWASVRIEHHPGWARAQ